MKLITADVVSASEETVTCEHASGHLEHLTRRTR
jgi:hypothetical protein